MRVGIGRSTLPDRPGYRDAVALAICEALTGAAGLEPAPGERDGEADRQGEDRLSRTVRDVEGRNYQVVNVDVTLRTDDPPDRERLAEMREALADRMHVSPRHVSVTPGETTGTPPGADAGPQAVAVALVDRIGSVDPIHAALRAGG